MSDGLILDLPKLNEQEMQQLQVLLFRYLAHKPGGFANLVTDKLVNKCQLTPALVRWRIVRADGQPATSWKTAVDFRFALLPNAVFNLVYAPGTKQNRTNRPGRYVFYLDEGWSSARLRNGSYRLVVGAWDTRGNSGYGSLSFTIANEER